MPHTLTSVPLAFWHDRRGTAAIEFAGTAMLLILGIANSADLANYALKRMDVDNAAHVAAQAAWKTCSDSSMLPATENCASLNAAIAAAMQSTSLGTSVHLASNYPAEAYYCVTSSNTLQAVGSLASKPADCSAVGSTGTSPGDYITIQVNYTYTPLFGLSVIGALGMQSIRMTSWMRLG